MKITLAQLNYTVGDFSGNTHKIIQAITKAKSLGSEFIVFSELAVCGYPPLDFLEHASFIGKCIASAEEIAVHCTNITALIGCPWPNPETSGKKLMNAALFLAEGKVNKVFFKGLLPTYDVFDEYRYFEPANAFDILSWNGKQIAITICEDLWDEQDEAVAPLNHSAMYKMHPLREMMNKKPDLVINIAASPFAAGHDKRRQNVLQRNCRAFGLPLVYVNQVGANTELIFDGGSRVLNKDGMLLNHPAYFEESVVCVDLLQEKAFGYLEPDAALCTYRALVLGIQDYFRKSGFSKALLGLSGGVDSALTLVLAVHALGKEQVLPVLMPSQYSSDHSISDSVELCKRLGISYTMLPIEKAFSQLLETLDPIFKGTPAGIAEENIQARTRGLLLMGISNKHGYVLLNTTNKSEMAVGYGTLYGDMCGGLSVLGDVYKTGVYRLCSFLNNQFNNPIPEHILLKAPSAELRPNQADTDSLPPYEVLDEILYNYIEEKKSLAEICTTNHENSLIHRVIELVNKNEYKRKQAAPVLRISSKAFGMGRRMPIVADYRQ